MKKAIALLLALTMVFALAACGGSAQTTAPATPAETKTDAPAATETKTEAPATEAPKTEPVTLSVAFSTAADGTLGKSIYAWAEAVTKATDGRINFDIYPNGQLGGTNDMINAVNLGDVDINVADASLMTTLVPELTLLTLPMLIKDFDGWKALAFGDIGEKLAKKVDEESNMHILGWIFNGFRIMFSAKEISKLEDCKGLVMRSPEAAIYIDTFTTLGFSPTPLNTSEVYTALSTGVVDACDGSFEGGANRSYYEVCPWVVESNHMAASMAIVINQGTWAKISPEDQQIMLDCYNEIMPQVSEDVYNNAMTFKQVFIDKGTTIYKFTPEEQTKLVEMFQSYWDKSATSLGYEDLLAEAIAMR